MGVNFIGIFWIKLFGIVGDIIVFWVGEWIYEDGSLNLMIVVIGQIKCVGVGGLGVLDVVW